MAQSGNLETTLRIQVRDRQSRHDDVSWNDDYTLIVEPSREVVLLTYEEPRQGFETLLTNEILDLDDLPDRVVAAMQQYADTSVVNWPTSPGPNPDPIEREEAEIQVTDDTDTYSFQVIGGDYIRVRQNGDIITSTQVPAAVQNEAESYIPSSADYLE
jgi:hypothetical protein